MKNIFLCICLIVTGCNGFPLPEKENDYSFTEPSHQSITMEEIKEQGKRACENGIPANANPYIHKVKGSVEWLDGYQEKLEELKIMKGTE